MTENAPLPLAGIRVLEFCQTIMGPSCGLVLADLGADVIKVEPAPDGDKTRRLPGFAAGFFGGFNRNKRSLAVDLKSDRGREVVHRLAASVDVVVENYAPGTMERLGCGWETLSESIRALSSPRSRASSPGPMRTGRRSTRWCSSWPGLPT